MRRDPGHALLDAPLVYVPEDAGVGRVAGEAGEPRGYGVELGDAIERQFRHQIGDTALRLAEQPRAFRDLYGAIGRIDESGERFVFEEVDVAALRRRSIGGKEERELRIRRHLPPMQHRVEVAFE